MLWRFGVEWSWFCWRRLEVDTLGALQQYLCHELHHLCVQLGDSEVGPFWDPDAPDEDTNTAYDHFSLVREPKFSPVNVSVFIYLYSCFNIYFAQVDVADQPPGNDQYDAADVGGEPSSGKGYGHTFQNPRTWLLVSPSLEPNQNFIFTVVSTLHHPRH